MPKPDLRNMPKPDLRNMPKPDLRNMPAFPVSTGSDGGYLNPGMTLREHYVGQILAGLRNEDLPDFTVDGCEEMLGLKPGEYCYETHWPDIRAKWAVMCANAAIRALEAES